MMDFKTNTEELSFDTVKLFSDAWKNSKGDQDDFISEVRGTDQYESIPMQDIIREYNSRLQKNPLIILEDGHLSLFNSDMFKEGIKEKYPNTNEEDITNLFELFNALKGQSFENLNIATLEAVTECITRIEGQNRHIIRAMGDDQGNRRQENGQGM